MSTYIYLVGPADGGAPIRFGISRDPRGRLHTLRMNCPYDLVLIATWEFRSREEASEAHAEIRDIWTHERGGLMHNGWFNEKGDMAALAISCEVDEDVPMRLHSDVKPYDVDAAMAEWQAREDGE